MSLLQNFYEACPAVETGLKLTSHEIHNTIKNASFNLKRGKEASILSYTKSPFLQQLQLLENALIRNMSAIITKISETEQVFVPNDNVDLSFPSIKQQQLISIHFESLMNAYKSTVVMKQQPSLQASYTESLVAIKNVFHSAGIHHFIKLLLSEMEKVIKRESTAEALHGAEIAGLLLASIAGLSGVVQLLTDYLPTLIVNVQFHFTGQVYAHFTFIACIYSLIHISDSTVSAAEQLWMSRESERNSLRSFIQTLVSYLQKNQATPHPSSFFASAFVQYAVRVPDMIRKGVIATSLSDASTNAQSRALLFELAKLAGNSFMNLFDLDTREGRDLCALFANIKAEEQREND
jgi:hypothetical protein